MKWSPKKRMLWLIPLLIVAFPLFGLAMLSLSSKAPQNLGAKNGRLRDCPSSPNCVCTQANDRDHQMPPLSFEGTPEEAMRGLESALAAVPGVKVVDRGENYLHAEATSRIFRFVDDIELLVDPQQRVIHFRSASRVGHSDLGANRKRMERLREAFESSH